MKRVVCWYLYGGALTTACILAAVPSPRWHMVPLSFLLWPVTLCNFLT